MKGDLEPGTTHNITVVFKDGRTYREIAGCPLGYIMK